MGKTLTFLLLETSGFGIASRLLVYPMPSLFLCHSMWNLLRITPMMWRCDFVMKFLKFQLFFFLSNFNFGIAPAVTELGVFSDYIVFGHIWFKKISNKILSFLLNSGKGRVLQPKLNYNFRFAAEQFFCSFIAPQQTCFIKSLHCNEVLSYNNIAC